jgi:DNA-binding MarR family transcriptional regulator
MRTCTRCHGARYFEPCGCGNGWVDNPYGAPRACPRGCHLGRNRGFRGSVDRSVAFGRSGAVVESDLVAVGVGEGECPTEGAVDRCGDDGVTVGDESIVNGLDVCGVEPDRGTDAGLSNGCEIGAGNDVAECERDRLRLEDDGVRRSGLRADEAEVLLVERLRSVEVARLQRDEVGAGGGHDDAPSFRVSFLTQVNLCQNSDMSQDGVGVNLETSLGYLLKEASSALRAAMEEVLRPLGMSVTHYSCLELLAQRPGLSNSELARGAFVTRQSMNVLLQALEQEGYVTRPAEAPVGKILPTRLTPRGRRSLEKATVAVRSVEVRMLAGMTEAEQSGAFRILQSMIHSLRDGNDGA